MKLVRTTSANPDFHTLIHELDQELWERYQEVLTEYEELNKVLQNNHVVVAYIEEKPAGCGCFKHYNKHTIELKRMFVRGEFRGRGVAFSIIQELERWAREENYTDSLLETGSKQPEAVGLYQKLGYQLIDTFEPYIGMSDSICMRKSLFTETPSR